MRGRYFVPQQQAAYCCCAQCSTDRSLGKFNTFTAASAAVLTAAVAAVLTAAKAGVDRF